MDTMGNHCMETSIEHGEIQALETRLLLQAIYERYGYDYRNYAPGSLHRRVRWRRIAGHSKCLVLLLN